MDVDKSLQQIINYYNSVIKTVEKKANEQNSRAYGGVVRSKKGKLQEYITEKLVKIAWKSIKGDPKRLNINSTKIPIRIKQDYIDRIKDSLVKKYVQNNIIDHVYRLSVDKHIFIDDNFVIGIECKSYTENAMIKRILVDFDLLMGVHPNISCYLLQLESQLGGDYSALNPPTYGSHSTHAIQSNFSCDLNIITLLEGERKVNKPIHKFFKPLTIKSLKNAVNILSEDLVKFL